MIITFVAVTISLLSVGTVFSVDAGLAPKRKDIIATPDRRGSDHSTDTIPDSRLSEDSHEEEDREKTAAAAGGASEPHGVSSEPVLWTVTTEFLRGMVTTLPDASFDKLLADTQAARSNREIFSRDLQESVARLVDKDSSVAPGLAICALLLRLAAQPAIDAGKEEYDNPLVHINHSEVALAGRSGACFELNGSDGEVLIRYHYPVGFTSQFRYDTVPLRIHDIAQWLRDHDVSARETQGSVGISSRDAFVLAWRMLIFE